MKKILLVDDDQDIRDAISFILDMEGFDVLSLDNGRDVLSSIYKYRPNLILLDALIGELDGRDICKEVKSSPLTAQLPVIIVSATHGYHTRHEKQCGADDYIEKPFDMEQLISCVRKHLF